MFFFRASAKKEKTELAKMIKTQKDADELRRKMQRAGFTFDHLNSPVASSNVRHKSHNATRAEQPRRQYTISHPLQSPPIVPRTPAPTTTSTASDTHTDSPLSSAFRDIDAQLVDDILRLLHGTSTTLSSFAASASSPSSPSSPPSPARMRTPTAALRAQPPPASPPAPAALAARSQVAELVEPAPDPLFAPLDTNMNNINTVEMGVEWRPAGSVMLEHPLKLGVREEEDMPVVPPSPRSTLRRSAAQRLPSIPRRHKLLRNIKGGSFL